MLSVTPTRLIRVDKLTPLMGHVIPSDFAVKAVDVWMPPRQNGLAARCRKSANPAAV